MVEKIKTVLESFDPSFDRVNGDEWTERIFDDGRWTEGPAYFPASRTLVFSDIPNDRVMQWSEATGAVGVLTHLAGYPNGHTIDRQGRLITCEQGQRSVTRTEHDGSRTVLADRVGGARFNSPNDVVEHSDGSLWFTDPSYGIDSDYEGVAAPAEVDGCHVYRLAPDGTIEVVADDFERPNGLAFSADESTLYVVDTRHKHLRRFAVEGGGADAGDRLTGGEVIAECDAGSFDGVRVDNAGRLWVAAGDGLQVFSPAGDLLGKLRLPEVCSNLVFGGARRNQLFVTASSSVYALRLNVAGCAPRSTTATGVSEL